MMMHSDKRLAPRKLQKTKARLWGSLNYGAIECELQDISATGARLRLPFDVTPHAIKWKTWVTLVLPNDRTEVDGKLIRRSKHDVGIQFCSPFRRVARIALAA
jgi:hypothetical protein